MDAVICPSFFMKGMLDTDPDLASKTVYLQNFVRSIEKKTKKKGGYILYFRVQPDGYSARLQGAVLLRNWSDVKEI